MMKSPKKKKKPDCLARLGTDFKRKKERIEKRRRKRRKKKKKKKNMDKWTQMVIFSSSSRSKMVYGHTNC